jgi:hypothetical protein
MVVVVWLAAGWALGTVAAENAATAHRPLAAIRADVSAALRREATSRRAGDNTPDVLRLVDLYREMAAHPQRDKSAALKEMGLRVRARLQTVRGRIERQLDRTNKSHKSRVLAQQIPQAGAAGAGQAAGAGSPVVGVRPTDFGPELVELIQATISPDTWRINGGNGAIVYYSPLHVLVVSAPGEVHAQVGDLLGQLHAAQRRQDGAQMVAEIGAVRAQE